MSDPSDKALAQAFREAETEPGDISWDAMDSYIRRRARELDAAKGATPPAQAAEAVEPLTASMCHHPEYAKGWNAAIAAIQAGE